MLQFIAHACQIFVDGRGGGGGGGGVWARSITINNLFDQIQWFETLRQLSNQDLDVGEGEEDWCQLPLCTCDSTCPLAFSPFNIVNIEDSDWLEPSIFNSLTHSF